MRCPQRLPNFFAVKLWHNSGRTYGEEDFAVEFFPMFSWFALFHKVDRRIDTVKNATSFFVHVIFTYEDGPVAQRLEQGTHNPLVPGSNPGGPSSTNYDLR